LLSYFWETAKPTSGLFYIFELNLIVMTLNEIVNKAKLLPTNIKAFVLTFVVIIVLVLVILLLIRSNTDAKTAVEIEKLKPQIEKTKLEAKQKADELKNSVLDHDKSVQEKTKEISKVADVKPFKPMKHEIIKVKSASYNAMRAVLDTIQPIK
jgi:hypothetical protein